jgi:flavin reductase (DIM6/NTAB) family NADH-FMN oxidoreductase RutF
MQTEPTKPIQAPVEAFRHFFRKQVSTVTVITASDGRRRAGLTATAVCSLMDSPPSLIVSIGRHSRTAELALGTRRFGLNLLNEDQADIARVFARHAANELEAEEKFQDTEGWIAGPEGIPVLSISLGSAVCDVFESHEFTSHVVVLGTMRDITFAPEGWPLLYGQQKFCRLPRPEPTV